MSDDGLLPPDMLAASENKFDDSPYSLEDICSIWRRWLLGESVVKIAESINRTEDAVQTVIWKTINCYRQGHYPQVKAPDRSHLPWGTREDYVIQNSGSKPSSGQVGPDYDWLAVILGRPAVEIKRKVQGAPE